MQLTFYRAGACRPPVRWWRYLVAALLAAWAAGCASLPANVDRKHSTAWAAPEQTALGQFVAQRRAQDRARSESGFLLLDSVEAAYASRISLVRAAQKTIDLQYYAIHADQSTEKLLQALRDAALRGVRVRLLLDDFNTVGKDAQVLRLAFVENVEVRLFNPLAGPRDSLVGRIFTSIHDTNRIAKRMHNKLFIVDNAVGITGGRNLGDAYFGGDGKSSFVDLDVLAAGRIVQEMSTSFDRYWNHEMAYPMQALVKPEELKRLRKAAQEQQPSGESPLPQAHASQPQPPSATGNVLPNGGAEKGSRAPVAREFDLKAMRLAWAPALFLQDKPGKIGPDDDEVNAGDTVVDGLLHLMDGAKQDVLIVSPYFVPGEQMMERFRRLKARGVRVRVLTNSLASNDAPAAHAGYVRYRKDLVAAGVELHEMRAANGVASSATGSGAGSESSNAGLGSAGGGSKGNASRASLHSKAVVIDGRLAIIGSMNLDLRSQVKNSEVALVVRNAAFARAAMLPIENMMQHGAYRVVARGSDLYWQAPPGAGFKDATSEPEATAKQKLLVGIVAPFAPDEML